VKSLGANPVRKSFGLGPAHTPYGVRGRVRARARARARARMERLVLVCSRSSRLGYRSRWGMTLQPRQEVVWPRTGSHTLRCSRSNRRGYRSRWGMTLQPRQQVVWPSDRLTHPTVFAVEFVLVLVLVLVLEWNVWSWCVRGRVEWAMKGFEEPKSKPVRKSSGLPTGSHTLRCSRSNSCSNGTLGSGVFAVESTGLSVAMGHDAPTPSGSRLASDRLTHPTIWFRST
jgi:hypothetical protein